MRFANLLVSTLAATAMLTSAPAQPLPQLDALLPGHRLVVNSSAVPWIYACDCFQLRLIRIQSQTGVREVVASDPVLFNFPVKVQFLPPVFGLKPLVVASDQEHRLAAINAALTADITQPPWIVTKVLIFGQH